MDSELHAHEVFTGLNVLSTVQSAPIVSAFDMYLLAIICLYVRHMVSAMMERVT